MDGKAKGKGKGTYGKGKGVGGVDDEWEHAAEEQAGDAREADEGGSVWDIDDDADCSWAVSDEDEVYAVGDPNATGAQ